MDGSSGPDVTLERLHEIADAFARRDVDGIVNAFAEDGEFRNARGPAYWGQSFKGKAAIRSYFEPLSPAQVTSRGATPASSSATTALSPSGTARPPSGRASARNGSAATSTSSAAA
jgi:hypothetical protein